MPDDYVDRIQRSWNLNASAWTSVVRDRQIESRRLATDAAILEATLPRKPGRVLDLGCGEGWLCREFVRHGMEVVGTDASAALIEAAAAQPGARYEVMSYSELAAGPERLGRFDAVVCNFSLLEQDLSALFLALHRTLAPNGALIVQTVHPWTSVGDEPYADGWRVETFEGFAARFVEMPWFYRTLASWIALVTSTGWRIEELREPLHPATGRPASLLFVAVSAA